MAAYHSFLNPTFHSGSIDIAGIQRAILDAITVHLPMFQGIVLDVGCGEMPYKPVICRCEPVVKRYIGMDLENNAYSVPDVVWDGITMPFESGVVDTVLATEVLEHCPNPEGVLKEAFRVLAPGGGLFLTVPFVWPIHCAPHDEYRYTPFSLKRHLLNAGFQNIEIHSLGGWDACLATMVGLWIRRRPMNHRLRRVLSLLATPVVRWLWSIDKPQKVDVDQSMPIGLYATAKRIA